MNTLYTWLGFTDIKHMKEDKNAAVSTLALFNDVPFDQIIIFALKIWSARYAEGTYIEENKNIEKLDAFAKKYVQEIPQ